MAAACAGVCPACLPDKDKIVTCSGGDLGEEQLLATAEQRRRRPAFSRPSLKPPPSGRFTLQVHGPVDPAEPAVRQTTAKPRNARHQLAGPQRRLEVERGPFGGRSRAPVPLPVPPEPTSPRTRTETGVAPAPLWVVQQHARRGPRPPRTVGTSTSPAPSLPRLRPPRSARSGPPAWGGWVPGCRSTTGPPIGRVRRAARAVRSAASVRRDGADRGSWCVGGNSPRWPGAVPGCIGAKPSSMTPPQAALACSVWHRVVRHAHPHRPGVSRRGFSSSLVLATARVPPPARPGATHNSSGFRCPAIRRSR